MRVARSTIDGSMCGTQLPRSPSETMRVAVASWTSRHTGGVESYLAAVMPAMRDAGIDVSFFHEVDEAAQRSRIDAGGPVFSVVSSGVEGAIAELSRWKPDVIYMHGLH